MKAAGPARFLAAIYIVFILTICLNAAVFCGAPPENNARSIYIGDIISLELKYTDIWGARINADELRERFGAFETVDLKETPDGWLLSLRTFETGEHIINIGGTEIIIEVRSTLTDIDKSGLFEPGAYVLGPGFYFRWRPALFIALTVFGLSGCYILVKFILKKKEKALSPRMLFYKRSGALSDGDALFFVRLTFYFKEYIEGVYGRRIIGKTSKEITDELRTIPGLAGDLAPVGEWLAICDRYKFTGMETTAEQKIVHRNELRDLVAAIDARAEGGAA